MVGIPWFIVSRKVPPWHDDRIAFDRLFMHDPGMARRTTLPPAALCKRIDMFTMAHDETDVVDRWRQIARGDLGHAKNVPVTTQADSGIDFRLQIMRIGRGAEQVDRYILRPGPGFIVEPPLNARSYVAGDAGHLSMRGFYPTLIRGGDGMATGAEGRVIRDRGGHSAQPDGTSNESQNDGRFRFPAHAPHETVILETAS